ncbi:hypothetical protein ACFY05_31835 [Microtetraspora fusca]|uniref:Uncharacterized protein n=1 Tax=Microtetraspora fusca TaxID=1997 RepID=A0ABW6VEX3_MICFU
MDTNTPTRKLDANDATGEKTYTVTDGENAATHTTFPLFQAAGFGATVSERLISVHRLNPTGDLVQHDCAILPGGRCYTQHLDHMAPALATMQQRDGDEGVYVALELLLTWTRLQMLDEPPASV